MSAFMIAFETFLEEAASEGKYPLLVIDEAHTASARHLEQIRLLSNIEQPRRKLLNIFLIGQNELDTTLASPACRALRQRISFHHRIGPLSECETQEYIAHRLKIAGTDQEVFSGEAVRQIFHYSRGYPRLVNIICARAIWAGNAEDSKQITPAAIAEYAAELRLTEHPAEVLKPDPLDTTQGDADSHSMINLHPETAEEGGMDSNGALVIAVPLELSENPAGEKAFSEAAGEKTPRALRGDLWLDSKHRQAGTLLAALVIVGVASLSHQIPFFRENSELLAAPDTVASSMQAPTRPVTPGAAAPGPLPPKRLAERQEASRQSAFGMLPRAEGAEEVLRAAEPLEQARRASQARASEFRKLRAQSLHEQAALVMNTDPGEAERLLLRAVEADPGNTDTHFARGKLYTKSKTYSKAIEAYREAAALDANQPATFFNLGFVYAAIHDYENAERTFRRVVDLQPPYLDQALFNLAAVQERQGKQEQSIENLEIALAVNSENGRAREYLDRLVVSGGGSR